MFTVPLYPKQWIHISHWLTRQEQLPKITQKQTKAIKNPELWSFFTFINTLCLKRILGLMDTSTGFLG